MCHACGRRHPELKNISIRTITCSCGLIMSRDQNAALNIKIEGLRLLKMAWVIYLVG
ncbi:MAG: transposase [Clostridiales bacterium]|nr:transposase [Clostridiales bacterium]